MFLPQFSSFSLIKTHWIIAIIWLVSRVFKKFILAISRIFVTFMEGSINYGPLCLSPNYALLNIVLYFSLSFFPQALNFLFWLAYRWLTMLW